jgi:hypothetical protein
MEGSYHTKGLFLPRLNKYILFKRYFQILGIQMESVLFLRVSKKLSATQLKKYGHFIKWGEKYSMVIQE